VITSEIVSTTGPDATFGSKRFRCKKRGIEDPITADKMTEIKIPTAIVREVMISQPQNMDNAPTRTPLVIDIKIAVRISENIRAQILCHEMFCFLKM